MESIKLNTFSGRTALAPARKPPAAVSAIFAAVSIGCVIALYVSPITLPALSGTLRSVRPA